MNDEVVLLACLIVAAVLGVAIYAVVRRPHSRSSDGRDQEETAAPFKLTDIVTTPDKRYPRWVGPVIGLSLGVGIACRIMFENGAWSWSALSIGVLAGFLAGCVMLLIDTPPESGIPRPGAFGTLLCVLALVVVIIPLVNILVALPAFLLNRRVAGWQNRMSRLGLGLALALTATAFIALGFTNP